MDGYSHLTMEQYHALSDSTMDSLLENLEDLLDTEYHVYENSAGTKLIRTPQYSLPGHLHKHIDVIQPTNYFGGKPYPVVLHYGNRCQTP